MKIQKHVTFNQVKGIFGFTDSDSIGKEPAAAPPHGHHKGVAAWRLGWWTWHLWPSCH